VPAGKPAKPADTMAGMDEVRFGEAPRAIVLAAGKGSRLAASVDGLPKPAVPLNGRPLIVYTLEALAGAGFPEAYVVLGYSAHLVEKALQGPLPLAVRFLYNLEYDGPAGHSLAAARRACGDEPFLLVMADHLLSVELVRTLLERAEFAPPGSCVVAADFHPRAAAYAAEATKLRIAPTPPGTRLLPVLAIGKEVTPADALDAGAFLCSPVVWEALDELGSGCELNALFARLAERGKLYAADVSGSFWYDVDTDDDLAAAAALLRGEQALAPAPGGRP
jgi:NDP-sugar pyrophosphorylase family protein